MIKNEQAYECQACKAVINERDLGSVRVDGYCRLYCPICQSEEIKVLIVGGEK